MPGRSRAHIQPGEYREYAPWQKKKANGIDQEQQPIRPHQCYEWRRDPLDATPAHIQSVKLSMDPVPTPLCQPMQNAGCTIRERVIIIWRIKGATCYCHHGEDEKSQRKHSSKATASFELPVGWQPSRKKLSAKSKSDPEADYKKYGIAWPV